MTRTSRPRGGALTDEVVAMLMREIGGCAYAVGSVAPSEAVLQRRFATTRYRLREAMDVLRRMGVVDSRPGIGTVILSKAPTPFFVQSQETLEGIVEIARTTQLRLQSATCRPLARKLAEELRLPPAARWWAIETLRFMRHAPTPIGALRLYVPPEFGGVREHLDQWDGPVFKLIERLYGAASTAVEQEIDSCSLDAHAARLLRAAPGSAALKVTRHWHDAAGRLIQVSVGLYPQGRSRYRSRLQLTAAAQGAAGGVAQ